MHGKVDPYRHLSISETLETQLRVMMDSVDELNQESIKFNKHQNLVLKQYQEKTRYSIWEVIEPTQVMLIYIYFENND